MEIDVAETKTDGVEWDEFVTSREAWHYGHQYGWKGILERVYGCETRFLLARRSGEVVGVLPLLLIPRSIIGGAYVTSLPGGICTEDRCAAHGLIDEAAAITRARGARYLKLRDGLRPWEHDGLRTRVEQEYIVDDIPAGPEALWSSIDSLVRTKVRKARKSGLRVEWGMHNFGSFYRVYATSMHRFGTPATPSSPW